MLTRGRSRFLILIPALLLLAGACSSSGSSKSSTTTTPTTAPANTPTTAATPNAAAKKVTHVFVINLENENYIDTFGPDSPAKYLNNTLVPEGQLLTKYYAIGHASLPNYIAQISGQSPNPTTQSDCVNYVDFDLESVGQYQQAIGKGCVYPAQVKTIGDQLTVAGKTWKGYMEDIANSATEPKTCRHPPIGATDPTVVPTPTDQYATRHDPWMYFHSIIDSAECNKEVVGFDALTTDLKQAATTPNLSYITPNICNDGHDVPCRDGRPGGLKTADEFLKVWVPKILASPAYKAGGMLVITLDEAESGGSKADATACCNTPPSPNTSAPGETGPGGGRVGALVISTATKPGTTNPTPYNHYSLLCSLENVWGLDHLGFAGAPGLNCFGNDVYDKGGAPQV